MMSLEEMRRNRLRVAEAIFDHAKETVDSLVNLLEDPSDENVRVNCRCEDDLELILTYGQQIRPPYISKS